jgi:hypothetical protein
MEGLEVCLWFRSAPKKRSGFDRKKFISPLRVEFAFFGPDPRRFYRPDRAEY